MTSISPKSFFDYFEQLLLFFGGAGGVKIIDYILTKRKNKLKEAQISDLEWNIKNLKRVYDVMNDITKLHNCNRFLIFKGFNSGDLPKPGNDYYVSVLHESHANDDYFLKHEPLANTYDKVKIDQQYIEMLLEIITKHKTQFIIKNMSSGLLKRIYSNEDIKYSEIFYIKTINKKIYFCSISSYNDIEEFDSKETLAVELAVQTIINIFSEYIVKDN